MFSRGERARMGYGGVKKEKAPVAKTLAACGSAVHIVVVVCWCWFYGSISIGRNNKVDLPYIGWLSCGWVVTCGAAEQNS